MPDQRSIFISYARKDARDLALRLRDLLEAAGYIVWLDTAQIEGGASWSLEIETAIDTCDALIAILTPASYRSEVCRGEQLRALRKSRRVLPILAEANAERPVYLEHLHYLDFSAFADGDDSQTALFEKLKSELSGEQTAPLPAQFRTTRTLTLPPLPDTFTPRADVLQTLRARVLNDESDRHVALTALRGMGGIGKTVMALALAHDQAVQDAFPDGIAWVRVGKTPEAGVVGIIQSAFAALGEPPLTDTFKETCINRVRALMQEKSILFVLDDVWSAEYIEPFLAAAPRCRVLVTTRGLGVANLRDDYEIGEVMLGTMNPDEAHELLERHIGKSDAAIPRIAERVGYLPLALKLVGSRLNAKNNLRKITGDQWLSTFKQAAELRTVGGRQDSTTSLDLCIGLSVDELPSDQQTLYHTLGIFPEDIEIPREAASRLWIGLNPRLSEDQVDELLIALDQLALIHLDSASGRFTVHDLLHDYNRNVLVSAGTLEDTHRALLTAYNPKGEAWATIADRYLCEFLAYHLLELKEQAGLLHLLTESPAWLERCAVTTGNDAIYAADVDDLIDQYTDPIQPEQVAELTALYSARTVVSTRASVFEDVDLELLARLGHVDEAFTRARLRPDTKARFDGLLFVYKALVRPQSEAFFEDDEPEVAHQTWSHEREIGRRTIPDVPIRLSEIEDLIPAIVDRDARATAYGQIATVYADAGQSNKANTLIDRMLDIEGDPIVRVEQLTHAAAAFGRLRQNTDALALLERAITLGERIERHTARMNAVREAVGLFHKFGGRDRALQILTEARTWAEARGDTLGTLAMSYASINEYQTALDTIKGMESVFAAAYAIRGIAASLSRIPAHSPDRNAAVQIFDQALEAALNIGDEKARGEAYGIIASSQAHAGFVEQARVTIKLIDKPFFRDYALRNMAAALARQGKLDEAIVTARTIESDRNQSEALRKIGGALAANGRQSEAKTVLLESVASANRISNVQTRIDLVRRAIRRLLEIGEKEAAAQQFESYRAVQTSSESSGMNRADQVLQATAITFARYGESSTGTQVAARIRTESVRTNVTREIAAIARHPDRKPRAEPHQEAGTVVDLGAWLDYVHGKGSMPSGVDAGQRTTRSTGRRGVPHGTSVNTSVLRAAVAALAQANHISEAERLLVQIEERRAYLAARGSIAAALARSGQVVRAMSLVEARDLETLLLFVVNSVIPVSEDRQAGSGLAALREAIRVAGWERAVFRDVIGLMG